MPVARQPRLREVHRPALLAVNSTEILGVGARLYGRTVELAMPGSCPDQIFITHAQNLSWMSDMSVLSGTA